MEEFKRMFIAMLFSVIAINASAYDFEVDGIAYNVISLSDRTCEVTNKWTWTSFDKYSGNVSIPKTVSYNGQTIRVIGIGDEAFEYCPDLLSVSIPNSVTSIGDSAFYQCI